MTGRIIPLPNDRHREVQALLPWYAAGRLDEVDAARIKAHLGGCPDCQAELRAEDRVAAGMVDLRVAPAEPAFDVDHGWRAMRRHIERRPARTAWPVAARAWIARQWGSGSPWMRWGLVAQSCALVAAVGLVAWQSAQPAAYRALGSAPPQAPGNVVVIFRPDITEASLRAVVRAAGGRLVDGPTGADAYVLRVPPEARSQTLAALRRRTEVVLAEPVDSGAP